jgi:hypothetical protein
MILVILRIIFDPTGFVFDLVSNHYVFLFFGLILGEVSALFD